MTEKRFTLTYEKIGKYFNMGIVDHETKEPFDDTTYDFHQCSFQDSKDEMEDLCLLLNELNDENEQLKQDLKIIVEYRKQENEYTARLEEENEQLKTQLQNTSDQRDEFHRGARENANRVGKLEKENEQLKSKNKELQDKASSWKITASEQIMEQSKLMKENVQLKEFKEKVFGIFDREMEIIKNGIEWGKETNADYGSIGFYYNMLERLKKELLE